MGKRKQVTASVISHKGCERTNNEDNFFFNGDYMSIDAIDAGAWVSEDFSDSTQLYAVCDGMGGAQFGERASTLIVRKMISLMVMLGNADVDALVDSFCHEASDEVFRDGEQRSAKYQGTTMAMVVLKRNQAHVYNVGDSRVYLIRGDSIQQLSTDHSEVSRLIRGGLLTKEQARKHPRGNVITQYIGMSQAEKPRDFVASQRINLQRGDRLLLCSDGITDLLSDADILQVVRSSGTARDAVKGLSLRAMELSGKDNLTAIVLDLKRGYPQAKQ